MDYSKFTLQVKIKKETRLNLKNHSINTGTQMKELVERYISDGLKKDLKANTTKRIEK